MQQTNRALAIGITAFMVISAIGILEGRGGETKSEYVSHEPIYINGNEKFTAENGVKSGNGTKENPYIIEGWNINVDIPYISAGIEIWNVDAYFVIKNCYVHGGKTNDYNGIRFYNTKNGKIENNKITNNEVGIFFDRGANNNTIINNEVYNNKDFGIYIFDNCYDNKIILNNFYNNKYGIYLIDNANSELENNTVHDNEYGISIYYSSVKLRNNILYNNTYNFGVEGNLPLYNDIDTSNTINGKKIFYFSKTSNLTINDSEEIGYLAFVSSSNITIRNVSLSDNMQGLFLFNTTNILIENSEFSFNEVGIYMKYGYGNKLINNEIVGNKKHGIFLMESMNIKMRKNIFIKNEYNFGVYGFISGDGILTEYFYHDIDSSNKINGKPIYYYVNQNNLLIENITLGYLALISCSNISIKNITIYNNENGILLVNTTNSSILTSNISKSGYGVQLLDSNDNEIISNVLHDNIVGIYLFKSDRNKIISNNIYSNTFGIYLYSSIYSQIMNNSVYNNQEGISLVFISHFNKITENNIYSNRNHGIFVSGADNNEIYLNNFINNYAQALDYGKNFWDKNGKGNYWSDYRGKDKNKDGIGDTPYYIDENTKDNYPLMKPANNLTVSPQDEDNIILYAILIIAILFLSAVVMGFFWRKRNS